MIFSQYLNYHFLAWLIPLLLLGASVNGWLFAFASVAAVNENVLYWYLALDRGVYWPYELGGILLLLILVALLVAIVRDEERRLRARAEDVTRAPPALPVGP